MIKSNYYHKRLIFPVLVQLLIVSGLSACASINRQVFTDEYTDKPVTSENVHIYTEEETVANCRKIALLIAKGEQPEERMLRKLRKVAGKLGANSILIVDSHRATVKDVIEGIPEAAAAGALGINASTPPAQTVKVMAYHCVGLDKVIRSGE